MPGTHHSRIDVPANISPTSIRRTAKTLGLGTDAYTAAVDRCVDVAAYAAARIEAAERAIEQQLLVAEDQVDALEVLYGLGRDTNHPSRSHSIGDPDIG